MQEDGGLDAAGEDTKQQKHKTHNVQELVVTGFPLEPHTLNFAAKVRACAVAHGDAPRELRPKGLRIASAGEDDAVDRFDDAGKEDVGLQAAERLDCRRERCADLA